MTENEWEPPTGDGTTDFDNDDVVVILRDRKASILPASLRRMDGDQAEALEEIYRQAAMVRLLLAGLEAHVHQTRALGVSWAGVGWVLGMTGEGARKRFSETGDDGPGL